MRRLVLASSNPGKLREFRQMLAPLGIETVPQSEFGIAEADEPHRTFIENALAKARHASSHSGLPALADDSGICVAALKDKTDRHAHYYCVIVLVRHATDPEPIIAEGRWHGEVVATPSGAGGFGYDPYFLLPDLGKTAAALMPDEKNAISHRGQAMRRLVEMLRYAQ